MAATHVSTQAAEQEVSGAGRIVVGVDGSDSSADALAWAIRQSTYTGIGLDAVITWTYPASAAATGGLPDSFDPAADAERGLSEIMAPVHRDHPGLDVRSIVIDGPAGPSLVDYSAEAELLVIGSRGHGWVAGLLLGSVSEYCVSHAHCPVLVLRHHVDKSHHVDK